MSLDPQVAALLEQMKDMPDPMTLGVVGYRQMLEAMEPPEAGEAVAHVEDLEVPDESGAIPIRVYRPESTDERLGVLVFFHGGGFVACGLDSHDGLCRALCNRSGCVVVSVAYRLSPEAQYPLPLQDCYAATYWVAQNAQSLKVDADRLAVGGDSAGGNFAAAVALMARDRRDGPVIRHQFLLDPALDSDCDTPSHSTYGEGYFLSSALMQWFWGHYLGSDANPQDPLASPSHAQQLAGLPPATVVSAECDPLCDEGERYAQRLEDAGVPVVCKRYDGMIHGFLSFPMIDVAAGARQDIGKWIAQALAP